MSRVSKGCQFGFKWTSPFLFEQMLHLLRQLSHAITSSVFFQHRPCHKTDRQAFVFSSIYLFICKVFAKPLCTCKRIGGLFHYSDTLERKGKENTCNWGKEGTSFLDEDIDLDLRLTKPMAFYLSLGFALRCML